MAVDLSELTPEQRLDRRREQARRSKRKARGLVGLSDEQARAIALANITAANRARAERRRAEGLLFTPEQARERKREQERARRERIAVEQTPEAIARRDRERETARRRMQEHRARKSGLTADHRAERRARRLQREAQRSATTAARRAASIAKREARRLQREAARAAAAAAAATDAGRAERRAARDALTAARRQARRDEQDARRAAKLAARAAREAQQREDKKQRAAARKAAREARRAAYAEGVTLRREARRARSEERERQRREEAESRRRAAAAAARAVREATAAELAHSLVMIANGTPRERDDGVRAIMPLVRDRSRKLAARMGLDGNDATQIALMRIVGSAHHYDPSRPAVNWIGVVTRRAIVTERKRLNQRRRTPHGRTITSLDAERCHEDDGATLGNLLVDHHEAAPGAKIDEHDFLVSPGGLIAALRRICSPLEIRAIVGYATGSSYTEIAARFRTTPKSVDNALSRVYGKVRKLVGDAEHPVERLVEIVAAAEYRDRLAALMSISSSDD